MSSPPVTVPLARERLLAAEPIRITRPPMPSRRHAHSGPPVGRTEYNQHGTPSALIYYIRLTPTVAVLEVTEPFVAVAWFLTEPASRSAWVMM